MDATYEKRLGENLRRLRLERKMSQEYLSAQMQLGGCDLTRTSIAKMESGRRHFYPDELKLLKEILKVSYDELFV